MAWDLLPCLTSLLETGKIASMKSSLQKLHKFLKLEAERGFDNRAVVGGLERMLSPWEAEARAESVPTEIVEAVVTRLRDYQHLSETSRQEALQGLWQRIQRDIDDIAPLPLDRQETGQKDTVSPSVETPAASTERSQAPIQTTIEAKAGHPETRTKRSVKSSVVASADTAAALNAPVTVLSGVGPRHAQTLSRLGLQTLGDMLYFFPRRYDDYSQLKSINRLKYGDELTVIATIMNVSTRPLRSGRTTLTEAIVSDGSGSLRVSWFNQPWIAKRLHNRMQVVLSGKIDQYLGRLVMNNPELEQLDQQNLNTNRIVPVYPLTANITQRWLRRLMHQVVTYWTPRVQDPLPESLRRTADLVDLSTAILQAHFPDSEDQLKTARHRLAFDEIFYLQLGMFEQKRLWQDREARSFQATDEWLKDQVLRLPFALTSGQERILQDFRADLDSGHPMNRLLQGDVGSGKTVLAALAIALVVHQGAQAALMAPTSILADQHFRSLQNLLASQGAVLNAEEIKLLIGATPEAEKEQIREGLANGEIKVVVGTHALIEDPVTFASLQFAIVDEQHRFGVEQRATLRNKGDNPHLLVMTATPIPRSLALTIYGDLDVSVLDEMPPGRQQVSTHVLTPLERERAYSLIRTQIERGHQAFIIYPLVEETTSSSSTDLDREAMAAVEEHQRLQKEVFPGFRLGLLHGRLKPDEKDEVMARFRDGDYDILVSTSVVEVGVDIPNATVMLVEGANRFGLAQLHQLRGRVGRGQDKSYCLLIPQSVEHAENERLAVMSETSDGFVLAEYDLEQRGPGEFLGTRQSGYSDFHLASLTNVKLIEKARSLAKKIFEDDPLLGKPEHQTLGAALSHYWGDGEQFLGGDIS